MARVAQLNLQGSALATTELPVIAKAMGVNIVLAQEPYCGGSAPSSMLMLPECSAPKVGIYVADKTTTCETIEMAIYHIKGNYYSRRLKVTVRPGTCCISPQTA